MEKRYAIEISYSNGDEENPYETYYSKYDAYKEMCKLAGEEAYVQNEDFDEGNTCSVYFDAYHYKIDLFYENDMSWCYYRIVEL